MPAVITRGKTFGSTEQVTNTKLHQLVDQATISDIDQTNMASGYGVIVRSTSAPSDTDAVWVDTNTTPPIVRVYDGTEWVATGSFVLLTNKSGGSVAAGDVVVADTANAGAFTTTNSAGNTRVLGVVMQTIANNADGLVAIAGARVPLLSVNGTTGIGDYLKTSTTVKQAAPVTTFDAGVFAIAMASRSGAGTITEAILIGTSSGAASSAATQAEMEAASSTSVYASPGRTQYHPGVAKAWINFNGTGTPTARGSHNVSSITDNGTGDYTLNWTTAFADANYAVVSCANNGVDPTNNQGTLMPRSTWATGSARLLSFDNGAAAADPQYCMAVAFGDQ